MDNRTAIIAENIYFTINQNDIVRNISFSLDYQESLVIVGSSGSGKSTLLKLCSGLLNPTKGNVIVNGIELSNPKKNMKLENLRKNFGFVFQDGALINNLTTFENLALPLRYHTNMRDRDIELIVNKTLETFELTKVRSSYPAILSMGQRKLISFARIMVMEPKLIFFDEPVSSVDIESAEKITTMIKNYIILGGTAISISHDMFFANALASKLGVIDNGRLIAFGSPSEVKFSSNQKVRRIIKSVSREADLADELLRLME